MRHSSTLILLVLFLCTSSANAQLRNALGIADGGAVKMMEPIYFTTGVFRKGDPNNQVRYHLAYQFRLVEITRGLNEEVTRIRTGFAFEHENYVSNRVDPARPNGT